MEGMTHYQQTIKYVDEKPVKPRVEPSTPFDLSEYTYSVNLERIERAATDGLLGEVPGGAEFNDCPSLGFDLLNFAIVEGGSDVKDVENKLVAKYGEDYSLRFTILEIQRERRPPKT